MTHTFVRALAFLAIFWACIVLASSRDPAPTGQLKSQQEQGHSRIDLHNTGFGATAESFDANARLTRDNTVDAATPAQSSDTRYTHDAVGNRSTKTSTTGGVTSVTTYSYDSADRLTQESTTVGGATPAITTYQWDANGNLAAKQEPGKATLYRFDPQNRLIDIRTGATPAAATAATASVSYAYDASGNRIKKATTSGATSYLMDSNQAYPQVALESSTTTGASPSTQSTAYVWGNQLIRQTRGSAASLYPAADAANDLFPLQGHLNTSLGAVDANGNLVEQTAGDAYGNLAQQTGLKQSHPYTGEYWDQDSQLLYLRARWYDPKVGRFVSADPFEGKQRNPRSLNRYVYAHSDPVHGKDPSGRFTMMDSSAASSAFAALAATSILVLDNTIAHSQNRSSVWDAVVATLARATTDVYNKTLPPEDHHTIPIYLCGSVDQLTSQISWREHKLIHWGLGLIWVSVTVAEEMADRMIPFGRRTSKEIMSFADTPYGRGVIASLIGAFYQEGGFMERGIPTIETAFNASRDLYIAGKTSLPACKRPR